jgi:hypothetical protein
MPVHFDFYAHTHPGRARGLAEIADDRRGWPA